MAELMDHLDRREIADVLSLVQVEKETWEAAQENLQIARIERESDSLIDECMESLDGAFEQLVYGIVDRALIPAARRYINSFLRDSSANFLGDMPATGLHQQLPREFQLQTPTAIEVRRIIDQQATAAIGIAGPRGSGKTTLIEWFCRDRSGYSSSSQPRVFVTAPVQYDPRDFLLYLFAEVCLAVIGPARERMRKPSISDFEKPSRVSAKILAVGTRFLLQALLVLLGILSGYLAYLIVRRYYVFPVPEETVQQVMALLAFSWLAFNLAAIARALRPNVQPFFVLLNHLKQPDRPLLLLSVGAVGAAVFDVYSALEYQTSFDNATFAVVAGLPATLLLCTSIWRALRWQQVNQPASLEDWSVKSAARLSTTELQRRAQDFYDEIRFQQTFTSGWGGKISTSSQLVSGEISRSEGVSLSRLAWTLPEAVKNLRRLLADAAAYAGGSGIIIGIDELDKIEDPAAARRFVDDIKAIFQIPRCFFLVSVSDDAVTSFETRGLPLRDAFDSAFDEVVRVDYGNLENSRDVLSGRVVGLPVVFVALCHALSGGLPRDLLRVTRYLMSLNSAPPSQLNVLVGPLVKRELFAKLPALVRRIVGINAPPIFPILTWAEYAAVNSGDRAELHAHIREFALLISRLSSEQTISSDDRVLALRACSEAEVAYLLGCTIVEYCGLIDEPEISFKRSERLASLALVRQKIAVHPAIAVLQLQAFRQQEGLPELALWTDSAVTEG